MLYRLFARALPAAFGRLSVLLAALVTAPAADPLTAARLDTAAALAAKNAAITGTPRPQLGLPGDVIATAIPIPGVPFTDSGNTCAYVDDYDEICPYGGSGPEVVYRIDATGTWHLTLSLCASSYDTKLYVYENDVTNMIACNDDVCGSDGFRSELYALPMTAGNTYYVVVDGYWQACGDYELEITEVYVELVPCPAGALAESEPDCADDVEDTWNGGCNSIPPVFQPLPATADGSPVSVCGTSGTFLYQGFNYRDTDWYELQVTEPGTITFEAAGNFPIRIALLDGNPGCPAGLALASATASSFPDLAQMSWNCTPGTYWYRIGPTIFTDIPCGAEYAATIIGYVGESALAAGEGTTVSSWGSLKNGYRR